MSCHSICRMSALLPAARVAHQQKVLRLVPPGIKIIGPYGYLISTRSRTLARLQRLESDPEAVFPSSG